MMVPGGLAPDKGIALQPGAVGEKAVADAGFTDILAALDAGAATIPATPDAGAVPVLPGAAPVLAAQMLPVTPISVSPLPIVNDMSATQVHAEPEAAQPAEKEVADVVDDPAAPIVTVMPPFIAPPITIAVTSPAPVVARGGTVAPPAMGETAQMATIAPAVPAAAETAGPEALKALVVLPRVTVAIDTSAANEGETVAEAPPHVVTGEIAPPAATRSGSAVPVLSALTQATREIAGRISAPKASIARPDTAPVSETAEPAAAPAPAAIAPQSVLAMPAAPQPAQLVEIAPTAAASTDTAQQLGEQSVRARLDIADETQLIDRLARDIAQLSGGEGRLKFRLNPEHLGTLHVEVEQRAEGVSLRFGTETEGARQAIADAQHRLVGEARAQGMRIAETHVDLNQHNQQGGSRGRDAQQPAAPIVITRGDAPEASVEGQAPRTRGRERFA